MSKTDFDAYAHLSNGDTDVQRAVSLGNQKASQGHFLVCITYVGDVLVLPKFSASVRDDISQIVYDNQCGYIYNAGTGAN